MTMNLGDFNNPQLNKTEKAIAMLHTEIMQLRDWNMGLQRQIVGILLHLKITPKQFSENTRNQENINAFLLESQKFEEELIKAETDKKDNSVAELFKPKE